MLDRGGCRAGITQQQADEILKELRAMRAAIEKLAAAEQAPRPAAPPAQPASDKVQLADVTGYMLGRPDAPITMVEFTDLQCPFCSRFSTTTFERSRRRTSTPAWCVS